MESSPRRNPFLMREDTQDSCTDDSLIQRSDSNEPKSLYSLSLKEHAPLAHILSVIPAQAQRGFSKFEIEFVSLDVNKKWIAIGSSVGTLFLYERCTGELNRLRYQDYIGKISCVQFSTAASQTVAFGTENGLLLACHIPESEASTKKLECMPVCGLHTSKITSIEWSPDGAVLFSGDANGLVVVSMFDDLKLTWSSNMLLEEKHSVVELKFHPSLVLAVSTTHRCILCHMQDGKVYRFSQVGKKDRKILGEFGCTYDPVSTNTNSWKIYTVRPGLRLWKANPEGVVMETILLKDSCLAAMLQPSIQIFNYIVPDSIAASTEGEQFGKTQIFQELFILTWNQGAVYIIDPEMKGVISATPPGALTGILDVACCGDEIFVLHGKRNLKRFSSSPEEYYEFMSPSENENYGASFISSLINPIQDLVRESSSNNVMGWFRNKTENPTPQEEPEAKIADFRKTLPPIVLLPKSSLEMGVIVDEDTPLNDQSENTPNTVNQEKAELQSASVNCSDDETEELIDSAVVVSKVKKQRLKNKKKKNAEIAKAKANVEVKKLSSDIPMPNTNHFMMYNLKEGIVTEDDILAQILGSYNAPKEEKENESFIPKTEDKSSIQEDSSSPDKQGSSNEETEDISRNAKLDTPTSKPTPHQDHNGIDTVNTVVEVPKLNIQSLPSPEPDIYVNVPFQEHKILTRELDVSKVSVKSTDESSAVLEDPAKEDWVQYKSPSTRITSLSASKFCLYITDAKENLFYTLLKGPGLHWYSINQPANQVSVSPSGTILWVLFRQSVHAVQLNAATGDPKGKWTEAAQNVGHIALDDHCAWFLKENGDLRVQQKLTSSRTCFKTQNVSFSMGTPSRLACRNGVLWVLNQNGKLYATSLSPSSNDSSSELKLPWREIILPDHTHVSAIVLGNQNSGWIVDSAGKIWFKEGVSISRPQGQDVNWQVSVDITTQRTWKSMANFVETPRLLAGSVKGLWMYFGNLLWASRGNITGNKWDKIGHNSNWLSLAASESSQGALWILSHPGGLLCLPSRYSKPIPVSFHHEITRSASFPLCISPSSSSLWLLCDSGSVWSRTGISPPTCLQGNNWTPVDLSQLGDSKLVHLSCGTNIVWACDTAGNAWVRVGPILPSKQGLEPAWIPIDDSGSVGPIPNFSKIYVSSDGQLVWGIECRTQLVYSREGVRSDFPIGSQWIPVSGLQAQALALSNTTVYAISSYGAVFKRLGIDINLSPDGQVWKQLVGIPICQSITVTAGDDLWVLDKSGNLLEYVSSTVHHQTEGSVHQHVVLDSAMEGLDVTDGGWEMISTVNSC